MKKIILPIIVTALSSHVLATPPANHNTVNSNQHQGIAVQKGKSISGPKDKFKKDYRMLKLNPDINNSNIAIELPKPRGTCSVLAPVNGEKYKWVEKTVDVSYILRNQLVRDGLYGQHLTPSYINTKSSEYCYSYVDPTGFPHHISRNRSCDLKVLHVSPAAGSYQASLKYSGCYLPSSKRHVNRMTAERVIKFP